MKLYCAWECEGVGGELKQLEESNKLPNSNHHQLLSRHFIYLLSMTLN